MKITVTEFTAGYRLETMRWLNEEATCLNVVEFTSPITMTVTVNNKFEECAKILINCFDDFTLWTSNTTALLDWSQCKLSTGADYTFYKYEPVAEQRAHYYFGDAAYNQ